MALGCSCDPLRRVDDCQQLAALVNPELEAIAELNAAQPHPPGFYREVAERYEKLTQRVVELPTQEAEFNQQKQQYAESLRAAGRHARRFAEARAGRASRSREKKLEKSRAGMRTVERQHTAASKRLDALCTLR